MFQLKNITKKFGDEVALSNISLSINGGMNYIIGASGSGKTTLLRILSAMDTKYEGEAFYQGKDLKVLTDKEKSQLYATEFGFIAQGFHLIDQLSVRENILLPAYLKDEQSKKKLKALLKKLNIEKLENQKVSTLSGGQKQRVAIGRELMKNPKVLIADEPTAALDGKTAKDIASLLASIAKERTVIVVTHDTSLIQGKASIYELDKGVLSRCETSGNQQLKNCESKEKTTFSTKSALAMGKVNVKRHLGKILSLILAVTVAASCLTVNFSGMLGDNGEEAFTQLIEEQGNAVLNLDIVPSFMNASATGTETPGESQSVTQDISGLMDQYQKDERIAAIIMDAPIDDMVVNMGGKDFIVEKSGQAPIFNKLVAGKIADNSKNQVVLPKLLVEKLGKTNEEIIGEKLSFIGTVYNWDSGEAVVKPVSFQVTVSGVADTSYGYEVEGEVYTAEHEDSMFLSLATIKDIYKQAEKKNPNYAFTLRPTSPENYLEIYEELMSKGIVPIGRVELIRDIVGLKGDTLAQTGISYTLIALLSMVAALSICFVCTFMRKKEYAVYKLSGYSKNNMVKLAAVEYGAIFLVSAILCAIASIPLNSPIWLGVLLSLGVTALCFGENMIFALGVNPLTALKTGER